MYDWTGRRKASARKEAEGKNQLPGTLCPCPPAPPWEGCSGRFLCRGPRSPLGRLLAEAVPGGSPTQSCGPGAQPREPEGDRLSSCGRLVPSRPGIEGLVCAWFAPRARAGRALSGSRGFQKERLPPRKNGRGRHGRLGGEEPLAWRVSAGGEPPIHGGARAVHTRGRAEWVTSKTLQL